MVAETDIVAAVTAAEAAAVQLAQAYIDYVAAYQVAAQQAYTATNGPRAPQAVADLEHAIGPHRVAQFANARLVALGAAPVAAPAGAVTPTGAEWVAWLTDQIQAHVP